MTSGLIGQETPNLNIIENLWTKLKDSLFGQPRSRNREQLIARIKEEQTSLDQEKTMTLVESFQKQVFKYHSNIGRHTKY